MTWAAPSGASRVIHSTYTEPDKPFRSKVVLRFTVCSSESIRAVCGELPALTTALNPGVSLATVSFFSASEPLVFSTRPTPSLSPPKSWVL